MKNIAWVTFRENYGPFSLHGQNGFEEKNVYSSLFCFSLLGLHEEKGHVTHKESKKQGGKSSH